MKRSIVEITKFIENILVEKIRKDQWEFKIGNERDLESSIYYYLREELEEMQALPDASMSQKENLQMKSYKISTNYTIKGTDIWKLKKRKWKKSTFIMPDILLSRIPEKWNKPLEHKIAFELKTRSPGMPRSPNFTAEVYQKDFRKLNRLAEKERIQQGYYLLIYSDPEITEKNMKKEIKESPFYTGKNRIRKIHKHFKILLINRNVDPKTKKIISSSRASKRQERQQRIFRTYGGNDPRFKSNKPKNSMSGSGQKKAWKTMRKNVKKASWRRKFPNHPLTKEWKRKH